MSNLYYEPPTDEQFNEVKDKTTEIWNSYPDEFGYRSEKLNRIKYTENVGDNVMFLIAMFDIENQAILANKLSAETRKAISDRMIAGGNPPEYNPFLI